MTQSTEQMWADTVLKIAADTTEYDSFVRVDFDRPYRAVVTIRPCPDEQGQVVLMLNQPRSMEETQRTLYRQALVSVVGLRRHGTVEYAACLHAEEETVIARFLRCMLTPPFMSDTLQEMRSFMDQAFDMATNNMDELDEAETDTDLVSQGGLRI